MDIIISTLRSIAGAILFPPSIFILLILLYVFYVKNKKVVSMQKIIVGGSVDSVIELTLSQFVIGIFGGIIGSIILNLMGVTFNENSQISLLFLASIIMMFIKPKYICFSYSASILGIISIVLKMANYIEPSFSYKGIFDLDILYLMVFIGVMHVVEGLLVMFDGHKGAIPLFIKGQDKILGGYSLKRYWTTPLAVMLLGNLNNQFGANDSIIVSCIPNWWNFIKNPEELMILTSGFIFLFSFYAVIGYSSVTYTMSKREKAVSSGIHIFSYGIILIIVAQIARVGIGGEIIVVIFTPAAHEFMLKIQRDKEKKRKPKFVSDENGLVILEICESSKLKSLEMSVSSKIISINDETVKCEKDIYSILKKNFNRVIMKIQDCNGVVKEISYIHDKNKRLGALLVPIYREHEESVDKPKTFKEVMDNTRNK